jgi:hypothetical protein
VSIVQIPDGTVNSAPPARPKLSLRGIEPDAGQFWFVWVVGRRAPKFRHATPAAALRERDRLRAEGLDAHAYEAHRVEAGS